LALAVLGPEFVEGENDGARSLRLGPFANLAQGREVGGRANAQVHLLVRILQVFQLLVANQNYPGFWQAELPRTGKRQRRLRQCAWLGPEQTLALRQSRDRYTSRRQPANKLPARVSCDRLQHIEWTDSVVGYSRPTA